MTDLYDVVLDEREAHARPRRGSATYSSPRKRKSPGPLDDDETTWP